MRKAKSLDFIGFFKLEHSALKVEGQT